MKYNSITYRMNKGNNITFLVTLLGIIFSLTTVNAQLSDSVKIISGSVSKKDFNKGVLLDLSIQDKIPGLLNIAKSGMPNEGSYLNFRGIHSFTASNMPLIVLNGVPCFANEEVSQIINGYSRSLFSTLNVNDIRKVTLVKGAAAAKYGSLGSNGVLLIETEQATSDNLDTRISFSGKYGVRTPTRTIPTLGISDFKNYFQDIGSTRYPNYTTMATDYPFLQSSDNYYSYLFNNNTNWMSLVQSPSLVTDNVFRVEGGDEIAKYNLSFGYTSDGGVIKNTKSERYNTQINTNIMVSRKVDIFTNVGLSYITSRLQEQGMTDETNPVLAASYEMPFLSPYKKESNGNVLNKLAAYNEWNVNSNPTFAYDNVSNPLAIVNSIYSTDKIYDANIRFGLNYHYNRYLTFTGLINLGINYTEEGNFIPGVTDKAILPQYYSVGYNTVRKGVIQSKSNYYNLNAEYRRVFGSLHDFKGNAGIRFMNRNTEYDFASGYNTSNDYYSSLSYVTEFRQIFGDNVEWKWLNYYLEGEYEFNKIVKANLNIAVDGSSVSGINAPRFGLFPSLGLTAMLANMHILPKAISELNLSADISRTGNSRFSSNYAKNYYQNFNLFNLGTIVRSNVPNTSLEWEKTNQLNLGIETSMFDKRVNLKADYFFERSFDLLVARNISAVYGSTDYFDNTGEIATQGFEVGLNVSLLRTKDFSWNLGGSISAADSRIVSLGNSDELMINFKDYNNDDATVIMRKGESPYQFYGYRTNGIYSSTDEAVASGLKNIFGNPYQGGDVVFVNENNSDNVINAKDKVLLGTATPDFFGSINTAVTFKQFTLTADFGYSVGNIAYNAVRRQLESMSNFHNQSQSVLNRWQIEGQNATQPRAAYGDPAGNNLFSDRWLEDASYLKLRNVALQYNFGNIMNICQSGFVYVNAENLLTLTHYLGSDPEFSYSGSSVMQGFDYAKVARPTTIQFGFQLFF